MLLLVDRLLERDEYSKFWALKWGDLLKMTSQLVGKEGVYKYHRWVEEAFRQNMPYDQFATRIVVGRGQHAWPIRRRTFIALRRV